MVYEKKRVMERGSLWHIIPAQKVGREMTFLIVHKLSSAITAATAIVEGTSLEIPA